jgi:hypothetical protein
LHLRNSLYNKKLAIFSKEPLKTQPGFPEVPISYYSPQKKEEEFTFTRVQEYISEVLFGNQDIVAFYDRSGGVSFVERSSGSS